MYSKLKTARWNKTKTQKHNHERMKKGGDRFAMEKLVETTITY